MDSVIADGNLEMLKQFLNGFNSWKDKIPIVYRNSEQNFTVLHRAAYYGQIKIIEWYKEDLNISNINPKDKKGMV